MRPYSRFKFIALQEYLEGCKIDLAVTCAHLIELHLNFSTDDERIDFCRAYAPALLKDDACLLATPPQLVACMSKRQILCEGMDLLTCKLRQLDFIHVAIYTSDQAVELFGLLAIQPLERAYSARVLMELRGTRFGKARLVSGLCRYWCDVYAPMLAREGYIHLSAVTHNSQNAGVLSHLNRFIERCAPQPCSPWQVQGFGDVRVVNRIAVREMHHKIKLYYNSYIS